ncbi:MAG: adenylate/guanylate cyclase domain-containing protein [Actinomycetota bacterium]
MNPDVSYARNGSVAIAFEVIGDGAVDLVYLPGFINNLELVWSNPLFARFLERLATFSRLIIIDRRGAGLSDRLSPEDLPPLEDLADDVTVVLDTVNSDRAAVLGSSDCGSLCAMFAASHPDRTSALILYATSAKGSMSPDYQIGWTNEEWERYLTGLKTEWGTMKYARESLAEFDPSLRGDEEMAAWYASYQRLAASPTSAQAIERIYFEMDVRSLLPTISVPTLVLNRTGDAIEPVEAGKLIASEIPGARFVELAGSDHHAWAGDQEAIVQEIERFLSDVQGEEADLDRVLATVLFTDIVDSTSQAAAMGDRRWRAVRERHDQIVRAQLARYRGREIDTAGDGFLATFDGPARAVKCARGVVDALREQGIEIRAGLHTGEVEFVDEKVRGIAVHIGARVASIAHPGHVLVSSTVKDLVTGSGLKFSDGGVHELKGVPGEWHLFDSEL